MFNITNKLLTIALIFTLLLLSIYTPNQGNFNISNNDKNNNNYNEWIIKWLDSSYEEIEQEANVLDWLPEQNILRVKLKEDVDSKEWLLKMNNNKKVEYVHPNYPYKISEKPNDTKYSKQAYLRQINAEEGWDQVNNTENVTIAVLDTGVDLTHPDLKPNLIDGINLLDKESLPQDDNGHGTNVAGIVGATGNNLIGVSGVTWSSKIMPIKVLDENGEGDSFFVGQGIRYSVDNGADIILLALGEFIYTPFMKEAVDYAEENDVLVVAASGNEGDRINYPAAFPNVLSVGAVDTNDKHKSYSNYGQQIDVVAPGEGIYTTKLGGDYTYNSGTSMAAPQVAGLAALIMKKHPDMSSKEISNLIKYTADDVEDKGWDMKTGYGRINVGNALNTSRTLLVDIYEPNETQHTAHQFPIGDTFTAQLSKFDTDWYRIDSDYKGTININLSLEQLLDYGVQLEIIDSSRESTIYNVKKEETIIFDINKGTTYIGLKFLPEQANTNTNVINYTISNQFNLYEDMYEPNNKPWNAYNITNYNFNITGTFHQDNDYDWYKVMITEEGTLTAKIVVDSVRLDPVISIQSMDGLSDTFDYHGSGKDEFAFKHVNPGEYLIRVSDYNNYSALGEYELQISYKSNIGDNYEPNNVSEQAYPMDLSDKLYTGQILTNDDYDFFSLDLKEQTYISYDFGAENDTEVILYNDNLELIWSEESPNWVKGEMLDEGKYFLRFASTQSNTNYSFQAKQVMLYGNFIDIENYFARDAIVRLYNKQIVEGFADYTFRPNLAITRGELATTLDNALELNDGIKVSFADIPTDSELYDSVSRVYNADIIKGFGDNTFRPNNYVQREELLIILSRAFNVPIETGLDSYYDDVSIDNQAYDIINSFKKQGLLDEFGNQYFKPNQIVTRGELAYLIDKLIKEDNLEEELIEIENNFLD